MKYIPGNAQHIGARQEQQDAFGFSDLGDQAFIAHGGVLAVLADGMGGLALGSAASQTAVSAFLNSYCAKTKTEAIPSALQRALGEANDAVVQLAAEAGLADEVGTTLAAVVVADACLYWISAGDSRIYLLRAGQLTQLTTDHVYANELAAEVAQGRLSRTEAFCHPERDDLTSYLGLAELQAIDGNRRAFPLEAGDRILLCTDGLYRTLTEAEIASQAQGDSQELCETLVEKVLAKALPRQDNVTLVAFSCELGEGVSASPAKSTTLHKWFAAIAALLIVTSLAFGLWYWLKSAPPKPEDTRESPALEVSEQTRLVTEKPVAKPKKKKKKSEAPAAKKTGDPQSRPKPKNK